MWTCYTFTEDSHNTGHFMPYSFRIMCGFFNVPQNCEHSRVVRRGLRFIVVIREDLKVLTICRCDYKGSTFSSVILRPWVLVRPESNSRPPAGQTVAQPTEPPVRDDVFVCFLFSRVSNLYTILMFWFFTSQSRNMVQNSRKGPQRRNEISGVLKGMCRRVNICNRYVPILTQPFVTLLDKFFSSKCQKISCYCCGRLQNYCKQQDFFQLLLHLVHKALKMEFLTHWLLTIKVNSQGPYEWDIFQSNFQGDHTDTIINLILTSNSLSSDDYVLQWKFFAWAVVRFCFIKNALPYETVL